MNNFKEFLDKWGVENYDNYDENTLRAMSASELLSMVHIAIREGTQVNTYIAETIQAIQAAITFMDMINEKTDGDYFALANGKWSQNDIWHINELFDEVFECNAFDFTIKIEKLKKYVI